jgi:hypothetical protein
MHSFKQNAIDASWSVFNENTERNDIKLSSTGVRSYARPPNPIFFDDFLGDVIADQWGTAAGTDTSIAVAAFNAQVGGVVRMTSGNTTAGTMATNGVQLHSALNWKANQGGLIFEARVKVELITNVALFVGLTDQVASLEMPINASGTSEQLTSTADDAVGFLFDTAFATDNTWLVGTKAGTDATHQNSGVAPTADTFHYYRIEIDSSGHAKFFIDNVQTGTLMANAVTATVALTPVVAVFSRNSTQKYVDVDYIYVTADRA